MKDQTLKEIQDKRDELGQKIMKEVQAFQEDTGHLIGEMTLQIKRTREGTYQDLLIQVDVFDDLKPKPASNIVAPSGPIPNLRKS